MLRARVGSLDHSEITELKLNIASERERADITQARAKTLQAECVRVCQQTVALDREVANARASVKTATDKIAVHQSEAVQLRGELASARRQIDVLGHADTASSAVAVFHQQLQEAAAREKNLHDMLDVKTRSCNAAEARLASIAAMMRK